MAQDLALKRDPNCTLCKLHKTAQYVCLLGQGPKQCDVMIIGEAPGRNEDVSGKPFVGRSGKLLEETLADFGFARENVFITNAVSCRPPDNRTPSKGEIKACKVWLDRQIAAVRPKYILLLGNVPLLAITGETGIKKRRGRPFEKDGVVYLPTYHPAFILYDPSQEFLFQRDIKLFQEIVNGGGLPQESKLDVVIVNDRKTFKQLLRDLRGTVSIDLETTCLYPWKVKEPIKKKGKIIGHSNPQIVSIGFGTKHKQYIIPSYHPETKWTRQEVEEMVDQITDRLNDCFIVMHNGKFDCLWMWVHFGVQWHLNFDFDTMLAHYMWDENDEHGLKYLAQKFLGAPDWEVDLDIKQGKGTLSKLSVYQGHDLYYTRELRFYLGKKLAEDYEVRRVFERIMMPCARLFTEIEYDGVCVDVSKMKEAEKYLLNELTQAQLRMEKWVEDREDFNWGSPKQLGELLFGKKSAGGLGIPVIEKTKGGAASTSESVIKRIDHPIASDILKFRGAKQQLSFFVGTDDPDENENIKGRGWRAFFTRLRGSTFMHPSFKLNGTVTGRLSCENPNLQQAPRDVRIRQLVTAPPGWTLIEADLSQIELRIAAEIANERTMLEAFRTGVDVHWLTAMKELERGGGGEHVDTILRTAQAWLVAQGQKKTKVKFADAMEIVRKMGPSMAEDLQKTWNETNPKKLWKEIRKKAKAVNFGYLYGMWWKKFKIYARDNYGVHVDDEGAQASRRDFFELFPDFTKWHERQRRYARNHGYVRSLSGRKRRLPAAQSLHDSPERGEAERQAINSPVQSFANEINLMAAIQLRKEYGRDKVRMSGTVHDSIIMCVKNEYVEEVVERLLTIMTRPELFDVFDIRLKVPVLAEAKIGPWGASVSFDRWRERNHARGRVHRRIRRVPVRPSRVRRSNQG